MLPKKNGEGTISKLNGDLQMDIFEMGHVNVPPLRK